MSEQTTPMNLAPGSLKTWFMELRPPFLLLSFVLVFIGTAVAWHGGAFSAPYFVLAQAGMLLAHIGVNVLNDYFDYKSTLDLRTKRTPFSGGSGILPARLLEPRGVYILGVTSLLLAAFIGVYFIAVHGWVFLPIMVIGGLSAYFYSPHVSRWWLGEFLAGLNFGLLAVLGSYFAQTGHYSWEAVVAGLAPSFLSANLLVLNQFPDLEPDRQVGRRNLVMALGKGKAAWLYTILLVCTYLSIVLGVVFRLMPWPVLVAILTVPLAMKAIQGALRHYDDIPKLVPALGANVMTILGTDALLTVGYVLATVLGV
jgi:1,4-dihydroxy-2-naphthoate octaprenyltransferase